MTLNDQKEQFSIAYVRAIAAVAAVKVSRVEVDDDSIDVLLERTGGCAPKLDLQLKCTATDDHPAGNYSFPLKMKNYDDLRRPTLAPRWLVVLFVPKASPDWLEVEPVETLLRYHARWSSLAGMPESENDVSEAVLLPGTNVFTPQAVQRKLDEVEASFRLA